VGNRVRRIWLYKSTTTATAAAAPAAAATTTTTANAAAATNQDIVDNQGTVSKYLAL
jgi:hypothetical protein